MATGISNDGRTQRDTPSWARTIELVDSRRQESLRYNAGIFGKLPRFYDNYRGWWSGRANQFRNQINLPFTFSMIQSNVARKVQALFSSFPFLEFEGAGPEDAPIARKNAFLISRQMEDTKSVVKACDFFLNEAIGGTGVLRLGWRNLTRKHRYRKLETIAPGLSIPVVYEDPAAEMFNGPTWEVLDRLDFWQQPGRIRIEGMDWAIHRYWSDYDSLLEDANSPAPYFDPRAVKMLKDYPLTGGGSYEWTQRKSTFRNEYDYQARMNERFAKPVEIWEMHGLVPNEFAPDGVRHRCIAIGNERVVLKNYGGGGAMGNDQLPFLAYSAMPDPTSFDGIGKAEIAYGPQRTADRINNQRLDLIDLIIDPPILANSSIGLNTQNLFSRAGRVFLLDGAVNEDNIRPLQYDLRGLQVGGMEISELFSMMQLGTGETEALMGVSGPSRETARGFLGRQENALTRLALETKLAEEGIMEPLGDAFRRMDQLWLPLPKQLQILGSMATISPITGLPYSQEDMTVDYDDLAPDYRARAVSGSQMLGKSVRQQNYLQLIQLLGAIPQMAMLVNWANMARQGFELFDFKNLTELLVAQVPMTSQLAQMTGQSPEAVAGVAATPLERLDPQVLSQMFNAQPASRLAA